MHISGAVSLDVSFFSEPIAQTQYLNNPALLFLPHDSVGSLSLFLTVVQKLQAEASYIWCLFLFSQILFSKLYLNHRNALDLYLLLAGGLVWSYFIMADSRRLYYNQMTCFQQFITLTQIAGALSSRNGISLKRHMNVKAQTKMVC